jgi:hypothetical protein
MRDGSKPSAQVFGGSGIQQCSACEACPGGQCGCGDACRAGGGCCVGNGCRSMVDGIAGGFCGGCGNGCCLCPTAQSYPEYPAFTPGPPVGQVAYPYYTVHGPRDFLRDKPPTLGPY